MSDSGWNASALFDAYLHDLSPVMRDQFIPIALPDDLDALIALSIGIDKCHMEREGEALLRTICSKTNSLGVLLPVPELIFFEVLLPTPSLSHPALPKSQ